ncbi:putative glycoside hydrolase family 79 protein [Diplodia seriata]|uniref:Putative glycoside hydrolase family 79 protein n=1 Tax=Diplodia seriata TaxID=420778 RepID=A0A0G2GBD7_9PEZI|nr:putative glycoside hydrolase family 79 protein [Diplodia seriata]
MLPLLMQPAAAESCVHLSAPGSVPHHASAILDQSFLSFAIEGRDFIDYSGNASAPNEYSVNMLSTFSQKTGAPTYLRVGGTTQDHFRYDPSQAAAIRFEQPSLATYSSLFANITAGRGWLDGFAQFSAGADVLWDVQVFLARRNLSNAVQFARDSVSAIANAGSTLHALEIGNEPDLYGRAGFFPNETDRPAGYAVADYVREFAEFAGALEEGVEALGEGRKFQALALSNLVEDPWNEENAFDAGLSPKLVKAVSEHFYQSEDGEDLGATLMNKTAIRRKTDARFKSRIAYMQRAYPSIPFLIAEAASALGNGTGIRDFDLTASLGTALWTVDWLLYAATLQQGVTRVNMQLGSRFPFSPWLGAATVINNASLAPQTLGSFYGCVFVADFIGAAGALRVAELEVDDADVSAYAAYNSGRLTRVAVVNLELWRESDGDGTGARRPSKTVELSLGADHHVKKVRVRALTGPDAGAQARDIAWAGTQWTRESNGLPVVVGEESYAVDVDEATGSVRVSCQASEALLVSIITPGWGGNSSDVAE